MKRYRKGFTLIEMLVAGFIMLILFAGLSTIFQGVINWQRTTVGQNDAEADASLAMNVLADNLRGTSGAGLIAGSASDITFTSQSGSTLHYWKSGTDLMLSANGLPAAGTKLIGGLKTLTFTYYEWNGTAFVPPANPNATSAPANVGGIKFAAVVDRDGGHRQFSTTVRLRNVHF